MADETAEQEAERAAVVAALPADLKRGVSDDTILGLMAYGRESAKRYQVPIPKPRE